MSVGDDARSRRRTALETFPNPNSGRDYTVDFDCPEFTCVCPITGQPDFARIRIEYVPATACVEMKSLKLYLGSYRDEGHFHEAVTNRILDDLVAACAPRWMRVTAAFNVRGGIWPVITAEHPALGSAPPGVCPTSTSGRVEARR
ncbi:MAG: preQ(1) synthase [Planctomycetota bacterium]